LSKTVTAGIISAKNRSIDEPSANGVSQTQFQRFIQTDAAINPGNSGGPLVDMAGQVVGMNTAIYTQSMGSQGVGFAMPANIIANVYNMLIGPAQGRSAAPFVFSSRRASRQSVASFRVQQWGDVGS
jgi:serine protease Do